MIKEKASESTPWWALRVVLPKGAPNVLLIMTDDAGFGAPGTFGGVVPTPALDRIAGAALLALGVACWLAREGAAGHAAKGLVAAMRLYNVAVVAVLVLALPSLSAVGIGFWPVVLAHAGLAAWCAALLSKRSFEE